jgi:hypothetical protein
MKLTLDELNAKLNDFDREVKANRDKIILDAGWEVKEWGIQPLGAGTPVITSITMRKYTPLDNHIESKAQNIYDSLKKRAVK